MRYATISLACILCFSAYSDSHAQESSPSTAEPVAKAVPQTSYILMLTEYRLSTPIAPSVSASELVDSIVNAKRDGDIEPVLIIRMTALAGTEGMVQFAKRVAVTTGVASSGRGIQTKRFEYNEVGTIVRFTANPFEGKVAVKIHFDSSRLGDEDTAAQDDGAPLEVLTTHMESTQMLELDKPALLGSASGDATTVTLITVSK